VEEQVAIFLYVVGHNQRFRVMHNTFRRSIETISRYFNHVLYAIGELRQEMIKTPSGDIPSKILPPSQGIRHPCFACFFVDQDLL
jgi:hypothetical protein